MIDTKDLRQKVSNYLHDSQAIKDFCTNNFGDDVCFVYSGLDIENTPNLFPLIGVRVPKASQKSDEVEAILLIDLQIMGSSEPLKSGDTVLKSYIDEESGETISTNVDTFVNYSGEDVLDSFRDVVISEAIKATDALCNLTLREYQWEQDLLTTFPSYSGFAVIELYDDVYI